MEGPPRHDDRPALARRGVAQHDVRVIRARVLVADDHRLLREELVADVRDAGHEVVGAVGDADAAVELARRTRPDVCLLDIGMPGDGLGAAWEITQELPGTLVVIVTVSGDPADMAAAVRAGAHGYLFKDLAGDGLAEALQAVLRGERRFPDLLPDEAADAPRADSREQVVARHAG